MREDMIAVQRHNRLARTRLHVDPQRQAQPQQNVVLQPQVRLATRNHRLQILEAKASSSLKKQNERLTGGVHSLLYGRTETMPQGRGTISMKLAPMQATSKNIPIFSFYCSRVRGHKEEIHRQDAKSAKRSKETKEGPVRNSAGNLHCLWPST